MIFILLALLVVFGGLAIGSAYMYFKVEQAARPEISIDKGYRTRPRG